MHKLPIGLLFAQHPVLRLKLIAQFNREVRYAGYLPNQVLFGPDLHGIDFVRSK